MKLIALFATAAICVAAMWSFADTTLTWNGADGAPYRLDITKWAKPGTNTLETKPLRLTHPKIGVVE